MMNPYNPRPGEAYGLCEECGEALGTRERASRHMRETGHWITVLNPSRKERIFLELSKQVSLKMEDLMIGITKAMSKYVSEEEIYDELGHIQINLQDRWFDWTEKQKEREELR